MALPPLVRERDTWLNSFHDHDEEQECADGSGGKLKVGSSRPLKLAHLARGVLSCLAFLASVDALVARRMKDNTSRYFLLHTLANAVITLSSAREMVRVSVCCERA